MGYQEIVFKLENPKKFLKNKKTIDMIIENSLLNQTQYEFIQVKQNIGDIKEGFYLFIYGDRSYSSKLAYILINKSKIKTNYVLPLEKALPFNTGDKQDIENIKILKALFKEGRNNTGSILATNQSYKQLERRNT